MADEEEDDPTIELGPGEPVEGAPLGRVASRLSWPLAKNDVIAREGDAEIRTATGATPLRDILEQVDTPYFGTRREFVGAVRAVIGYDPVATVE